MQFFCESSAAIITYTGHGPGYFMCYFCSQKDWALRLEWYEFSAKLEPPLVLWLGMALGVTVFCKAWTVILLTRGMALGFIYHIRFSVFWAWPWPAFWAWPWAHIPYTVLCLLGMALGFMLTGPGPGLIFCDRYRDGRRPRPAWRLSWLIALFRDTSGG